MDLNIKNANRMVDVAALGEKVILTNIPALRSRSIDVNPDGSITSKKGLLWGQKITEPESEKPYQISPIPEGWRIEICDQMITNELMSKESRKPLNKRYVDRFNQVLRSALSETVFKDKFTTASDKGNTIKLLIEGAMVSLIGTYTAFYGYQFFELSSISFYYLQLNLVRNFIGKSISTRNPFFPLRTLNSFYEYFMPPVEVDRALRGYLFINLKGRNLVQLAGEFKNKPKLNLDN
jgi:hypothetical protein